MKKSILFLGILFVSELAFGFDKEDLVLGWLETKYENCNAGFQDHLILRTTSEIRIKLAQMAASPECQAGEKKACIQKLDRHLIASDFSQRAEKANCEIKPDYASFRASELEEAPKAQILGPEISCVQKGGMNRQTNSKICKAKAKCSDSFVIKGKVFPADTYVFHCDMGADGQCTEFFTQCPIRLVEVEATTFFGKKFGGSKTVIPTGAK